jgi:hypothetical protein
VLILLLFRPSLSLSIPYSATFVPMIPRLERISLLRRLSVRPLFVLALSDSALKSGIRL